ncbi:MFS transporter [Coralloluteibacterium thermophilus]|uniref:MFS transporter n=1 Tax=Coralloluteibacterium thermophilum TaxID=2707049 RepID=A0ABV9NMI2_9GAMM
MAGSTIRAPAVPLPMLQTLRPIASLLLGVALLLGGTGLLNTLIQLQGSTLGFSDTLLGALTSAYYLGFLAGTFIGPPLVRRIGHIRAFGFYAATCACGVLLHALAEAPALWMVLRVVVGMALVGLYTVIESWLNAQAGPTQRGSVFASYMMVNLGALAVAQQLLRVDLDPVLLLFVLSGLLVTASTLPVLITRMSQPVLAPTPRLAVRRLFATAPTAGVGAIVSGLAMGAFWGMVPVWGMRIGLDAAEIGTYMSVAIVGGAALQIPLGRLSDRRDRRLALAIVCALACALALAAPLTADLRLTPYAIAFLYGGMAFAVYPIVVAHLLDHLSPEEVLAASSSVLLLNGLGSAIGPLIAGALMGALGPGVLFAWFAATQGGLGAYALYRYYAFRRARALEPHFQPMLRTTPEALGLIVENENADGATPADPEAGSQAPTPPR